TRAHPLGLNLISTHSLGHQSSGLGFATSLSRKMKTHGEGRRMEKTHFQLGEDEILLSSSLVKKSLSKLERKYPKKVPFYCENYNNNSTLLKLMKSLSRPSNNSTTRPSSVSSPFRACPQHLHVLDHWTVIVLLLETIQRSADCSFHHLFLSFFFREYWNKGRSASLRRIAKCAW
ncbi:hypothetical protein H5410_061646, partial [Solanum commersonii]